MENSNGVTLCKYTPRGAETRTLGSITIDNEQKKKRVTIDKTQVGAESRARTIESIVIDNIDNDQKKKSVITDNTQVGLRVKIVQAIGIDNPSLRPLVRSRFYNVVCWVEPCGVEFRTAVIEGFFLFWNEEGMLLLENLDDHVFLNVEVQRFTSQLDPGTSNGRVVVGRARIPFPKEINREIKGFFELVRTDKGKEHTPEGEIALAMRLERVS